MGVLREFCERGERNQTGAPTGILKLIIAFPRYYPMPPDGGATADLVLMARRVQGLSQYALGRKLGVNAKRMCTWENGIAEPDPDQLQRVRALAEHQHPRHEARGGPPRVTGVCHHPSTQKHARQDFVGQYVYTKINSHTAFTNRAVTTLTIRDATWTYTINTRILVSDRTPDHV